MVLVGWRAYANMKGKEEKLKKPAKIIFRIGEIIGIVGILYIFCYGVFGIRPVYDGIGAGAIQTGVEGN